MKRIFLISLLAITMLSFSACGKPSASDVANSSIDVYGIKLGMEESDISKLTKSSGESSPCIMGYEVAYEDLNLNIGFKTEDKKCRRIMTENESTSIYGVKPKMTVNQAYKALESSPFKKESTSKYKFDYDNLVISLISTDGTLVKGITIETKE